MDPLPFNWGPLKEEHAGSFKVGLQINLKILRLKILRHFHLWVFLLIIPIWISAKFNDDKLGEHCGQLESPWIQVISSKCHRPQSWTIEHHHSSIVIASLFTFLFFLRDLLYLVYIIIFVTATVVSQQDFIVLFSKLLKSQIVKCWLGHVSSPLWSNVRGL